MLYLIINLLRAKKLRTAQIWSHLLKKFLMENFIFSAVKLLQCDHIRGNLRGGRGKKGCQNLHNQSSLTLFFF